MINKFHLIPKRHNLAIYFFLLIFVLGTALPTLMTVSVNNTFENINETNNQRLPLNSSLESVENLSIPFNINIQTQDNPEGYFPDFLVYSIETMNILIGHLFDETNGGFYTSTDNVWAESNINYIKNTYDNAQAILALLKLSDAVLNSTEKDYAVQIAEETANNLINELYDETNYGFYISNENSYKKPGIQAKAIQAFLALYTETNNLTYRDIAVNTFESIDTAAWNSYDSNKSYYIYLLNQNNQVPLVNPNTADPYDPQSKRADHNVLMGEALLDLYLLDSDEEYLTKAREIYNYFNYTCRNLNTGLFFDGLTSANEIVDLDTADVFVTSLVLEFLAQLYNVTQESKYYDDFFTILNSLLFNFWDNRYGGFYATYSYDDPEERDVKKYTERQFYAIRALDEAYKLTKQDIYYNLILDSFEYLNDKLYDDTNGGYFLLSNQDGTHGDFSWHDKYTVTQSLSVYALANLWLYSKPGVLKALWTPSTPLKNDPVTITTAAFDSDGISNVLFNYSLNNVPYPSIEMIPHSTIGNMYNVTLEAHDLGTNVTFDIIVNDTLGNQIVRGTYFFLWQEDIWGPQILEIGLDPGNEIPTKTPITITVTAEDIPSQGDVKYVRIYYQKEEEAEEKSLALTQIGNHYWSIEFPKGFPSPASYGYYFEAIDKDGNFRFSNLDIFYIVGHDIPFPLGTITIMLLFILVIVPSGLYAYVEYKRRTARTTLKNKRVTRSYRRRRKRGKRGRKEINDTMET